MATTVSNYKTSGQNAGIVDNDGYLTMKFLVKDDNTVSINSVGTVGGGMYAVTTDINAPNYTQEVAKEIIDKNFAKKNGGKPKRKSSKNRRKSKGGRKPKRRKSSKNRK